jgi:hypothetical protein
MDTSTTGWGDEGEVKLVEEKVALFPSHARELGVINTETEILLRGQPIFVNKNEAFKNVLEVAALAEQQQLWPSDLSKLMYWYYVPKVFLYEQESEEEQ